MLINSFICLLPSINSNKNRENYGFITRPKPLPDPRQVHSWVHNKSFLGGIGLNKLKRSYESRERRRRELENVEMLILPVKFGDGVLRGWLSEDMGARYLGTFVRLLCALWLGHLCRHSFLRMLLGLERGFLVSTALPAVCSCCGGRGPAGACWRSGRWSSLQRFSCLGTDSILTSKLEHTDREHCDLWHNSFPFPPLLLSGEEGA